MKEKCDCKVPNQGVVIGLCFIVAASIFSYAFYSSRTQEDTLSVTGSTKQEITSDTVKWTSNFSRTIPTTDLPVGYDQMNRDLAAVKKFFKDQGIAEQDLGISPVTMERVYNNNYGDNGGDIKEYVLRQNVEIQSGDVQKITALAKNIQPLINQGVIFSTQSVEYYYSKLPDLRIQMLGDAVRDAKVRANEIAKNSGRKAGALKSAGVGVVQVLPVNSVEVSDYGAYDTSSIQKEVMVTVKTSFTLK